MINHELTHVYNASACGDNCASWLLKIGQEKDVLVRLGHIMHFPDVEFQICIANTGEKVSSQYDLAQKVIMGGFLDE